MFYHILDPLDFPISGIFSCEKILALSTFSDTSPAISIVAHVQYIMAQFFSLIFSLEDCADPCRSVASSTAQYKVLVGKEIAWQSYFNAYSRQTKKLPSSF